MRLKHKLLALSLVLALPIVVVSVGASSNVSAENQEGGEQYKYTAQAGDSYIKLARKSVISFDRDHDDFELDAARVTAAESWLAQEAGWPRLNVGQEVSIPKNSVEKYVNESKGISGAAETAWSKYAKMSTVAADIKSGGQEAATPAENSEQSNSSEQAQPEQAQQTTESTENSNNSESTNNQGGSETPAENNSGSNDESKKAEESKDKADESSNNDASKKWWVLALVAMLVLVAASLIRSGSKKNKEE